MQLLGDKMKKLDITNPITFWSIVISVIVLSVFTFNSYQVSNIHNQQSKTFEQHSFNSKETLDKYDFPNINVELEPESKSIFSNLFSQNNNILILFLIVYSVGLSMLFTYRERSRISKEMLEEKIKIEKDRIQSKVNIYDNIEKELVKYSNIVSPEINLEDLDKKIDHDINYVLFSSRVVLEKVLLNICQIHNISEETLSEMIMILYKKRVLDPQTNGYAHTIKAFGNRVAHPSRKNPIQFTTKDAMLVLSTLVTFLNILESKKLLEGFNTNV